MSPSASTWIAYFMCLTSALVDSFEYPEYEPTYHYPLIKNKQYDFPTYTPLAYTSSTATLVHLPPLEINVYKSATYLAKNDGRIVTISSYNGRAATLTGGPFFRDKYIFAYLRYRCDGVPNNTRAAGTLDGRGFPIQFGLFFYNKRYGSYNNSLNYRDGLITIPMPVTVEGNVPNPLFTPFQKVLYKIKKPYSTAPISAENTLGWLLKVLLTGPYYSYPGSHIDRAGKFYFCSNDIHPSFSTQSWVSHCQYKAFLEILNIFGQQQVEVVPVFPLGRRPFVETRSPVYIRYIR